MLMLVRAGKLAEVSKCQESLHNLFNYGTQSGHIVLDVIALDLIHKGQLQQQV